MLVGSEEGVTDGVAVGNDDGIAVGRDDGELDVGNNVGVAVGSGVGVKAFPRVKSALHTTQADCDRC